MTIEELQALSNQNKDKARVFGKDSYIRFIKGKMKNRAEKGETEVTKVFENLNIPMPSKALLGEIIEAFQKEKFRVQYDSNNMITRISW